MGYNWAGGGCGAGEEQYKSFTREPKQQIPMIYIGVNMMTYSNVNIFRVTGPLWGESTGHRWIPLTKASDQELWCFLWSVPEQTIGQTIETPVIWDATSLIMASL